MILLMVLGIIIFVAGIAILDYGLWGQVFPNINGLTNLRSPGMQFVQSCLHGFQDPMTKWLLIGCINIVVGIFVFGFAYLRHKNRMWQIAQNTTKTRVSFFTKVYIHRQLLLLMIPGTVLTLLFCYIPMPGIILAFKKFSLLGSGTNNFVFNLLTSKWYGLENFQLFFKSPDAMMLFRNTIAYNLVFLIAGLVGAVALAIGLTELRNRKVALVYQTVFIFPSFISWVIVGYLVYSLLNPNLGIVNQTLKAMGIKTVSWYMAQQYWPYLLVFFHLWKGLGYGCIIYISSISGIDQELFQAAQLDGATKWQQIKHVTLPALKTVMILLTLLSLGSMFKTDFGLFWVTTQQLGGGNLYNVASTIDTFIYQNMMIKPSYSLGTAVGLMQQMLGFILVMTSNWIVGKIDPENRLI